MPLAFEDRRGRPIPTVTPLGRFMVEDGLRAYEVSGQCGIAPATLTEYLAGRLPIRPRHLPALCKLLDCEPEDLMEDS